MPLFYSHSHRFDSSGLALLPFSLNEAPANRVIHMPEKRDLFLVRGNSTYTTQVLEWICEQGFESVVVCGDTHDLCLLFGSKQDAMLFKLTWAGV